MVIAAGSVIKEPKRGATTKMDTHHAATEYLPNRAKQLNAFSENVIIGLEAAIAMITTTNKGSVKFRLSI